MLVLLKSNNHCMYQELDTHHSHRINFGLDPPVLRCVLNVTLFQLEGRFGDLYSHFLLNVLLLSMADVVAYGFH